MDKLTSDLANAAERALQWVDAGRSGNPSQARYDIKVLRQLIAEVREQSNKHPDHVGDTNDMIAVSRDTRCFMVPEVSYCEECARKRRAMG